MNLPESVVFAQKELIKENINTEMHHPTILGQDLQPIDLNPKSSWSLQIEEVNFVEFAEVQIINSWV